MILEEAIKQIEAATTFEDITAVFDRVFPEKVDDLRHLPFASLTAEQQAAIRAEVARQKAAVVLIKDSEGRLLSPNGKVSKLNEEQYRTVRTPWFKEWAGDWETLSAQNDFDGSAPYSLNVPEEMKEMSLPELRKAVEQYLIQKAKAGVTVQHPVLGQIDFTVNASGKTVNKSHDPAKLYVGSDIENVLIGARFVSTAPSTKKNKSNEQGYHTLISKIDVFGRELAVILTVKQDNNGKSHYNQVVVTDKKISSTVSPGDTLAINKEHALPAYVELDSIVRPELKRVNPDSVTKVVDPETGEPMVVYHGTGRSFDVFKKGERQGAYGSGIYFGKDAKKAAGYANILRGKQPNIMPVYLNIKNPYIAKENFDKTPKIDKLERDGYDGLITLDDQYIVFSPNQIKSTIGNLGTFSSEKGSIVESIPQDKISDNIKAVETLVNRAKSFDDIAKIFKVLYGLDNGGHENDRTDTADNSGAESSNTGTAQGRSDLPDSRADGADTGAGTPQKDAGGNGATDRLAQQAEGSERKPPRAGDVFNGSIAIGRKQKLYTAQMNAIEANYAIIEASNLVVSNSFDGKINPDYPKEIQPRNRTKSSSQLQIQKIANNIVPELMGLSAKASDGAPIIGDDGVVESGNGRTIALKLAYSTGKGAEYRQWLIDEAAVFGIETSKVESMEQPVLVRIRKTQVDRAQFAREANQADISAMSPAELAQADAERLSDSDLELLNLSEGETILGNSNKPFIKSFLAKLGTNEAAGYLDSKGRATRQLGDRAQAAIFAMAYDDEKLISLMSEESDGDVKNIISGLTMSALSFAKMDKEEADKAGINIIPDVLAAVEFIRSAKSMGLTLNDFLTQQDFFTARNETAEAIALYLESIKRSAKKIGSFFSIMVRGVQNDLDGRGGMFGDEVRSKQQIIDAAKKVSINESATTATAIMFKNGNFTIRPPFILEDTGETVYVVTDAIEALCEIDTEREILESILARMNG